MKALKSLQFFFDASGSETSKYQHWVENAYVVGIAIQTPSQVVG